MRQTFSALAGVVLIGALISAPVRAEEVKAGDIVIRRRGVARPQVGPRSAAVF